jgi:hypothetical protein
MDYKNVYDEAFSISRYNTHPDDEFRYVITNDYIKSNIIETLIDIGSGRGKLLEVLKKDYSDLYIMSCDINKYHEVEVDFETIDLSNPDTYCYFDFKYDLLTCLDVLEHLDKSYIEKVLEYFSKISKKCILTIANHSDKLNGVELHTIQEDDSYWTPLIKRYFMIDKYDEYYIVNGKARLYIYYVESISESDIVDLESVESEPVDLESVDPEIVESESVESDME